ncbi:hypothetical protein Sste5346_006780 [Sporothrix stenoceras]|uniref:Mid2 domain-containing protein n=1 Tax=Sporothrix stenoceras TaxID=5173 RepID=A0ABR3YYA6_9PEZI
MYSQRLMQLLFVALSLMIAAHALRLDENFFRFAEQAHANNQIERRASAASSGGANPTGDAASSSPPSAQASSTPDKTSTTPTPTPTPSETSPTSTPSPTDNTSTPPTTSSTPTTSKDSKPTTSSNNTPTDKTTTTSPTDKTTTTSPTDKTTTKTTQPISTSTFVTTYTESDGSTTAVTTKTTVTPTGSLSSSEGGSKTSGMSTSTRNIIIGVVVGVGGAIILVVIGLVALRIHKRKQAARDGGNGFNDYDPNYGNAPVGALEKTEGGNNTGAVAAGVPGRSPFQSTLESYHTPTQVNTASNF